MSIASQITALGNNIGAAYNMIGQRGGTVPARKNAENMATAIATIPSGGGGVGIPREISNGTFQMPSGSFTYTIPSGVTTIGKSALEDAFIGSSITSLDLSGVTTIGERGLYGICNKVTSLTSIDFSDVTTIGPYGMNYAFYYASGSLSGVAVDFSKLTSISSYSLDYAFSNMGNNSITSIDFSGLVSVGEQGVTTGNSMSNICSQTRSLTSINFSNLEDIYDCGSFLYNAFYGCYNLTTVSFDKLKRITGGSAFGNAFAYCGREAAGVTYGLSSVSFPKLEQIGLENRSQTMYNTFQRCFNLSSVDFSKVNKILGDRALQNAFSYCISLRTLSFPSLDADSFGGKTTQFSNMLQGCSNVTVHFPSAIQSTIGSWADVTNGFGGTNTTVLFDL